MFGKRKRFWDAAPLPDSREAVVVGGGVHGLSAAFFLAEAWNIREVAVLEAGRVGQGNSGRNAGVVRADQRTAEQIDFFKEGLELWPWLTGRLKVGPVFHPCGVLTLAHDPAGIAELRFRSVTGRLLGLDTFLLDPLACRELVPALDVTDRPRRPVAGGLFHAPGGLVRSDPVVRGLARAAVRLGVTIHEGVRARRIDAADGRVVAVETDRGTVRTPRVLIAAGPGSAPLARTAGVELPVRRFRRAAMASTRLRPVLEVALTALDGDFQASQALTGEIVAGSAPRPEAGSGGAEEMERSAAALVDLLPCMAGVPFARSWSGVVEATADRVPAVDGDFGVDGLFVDCGWGDFGFQAGPVAGKYLAEFMAEGRRPPILAPFARSRRETGPPAGETLRPDFAFE